MSDYFYLSFADKTGFLGGCHVEATSAEEALEETWRLGINPGGQAVAVGPIPADEVAASGLPVNKLMTREEMGECVGLDGNPK